jgi:hypothetical protein
VWGKLLGPAFALAIVTGCDSAPVTGPTAAPGPISPTATISRAAPTDTDCPTAQRFRLDVSLVSDPDVPIASEIVACTDDNRSSLSLHNTGVAVWMISVRRGAEVRSVAEDLRSEVFREAFGMDERLLTPKRRLVVLTSPQDVTWTPDVALTGSWIVHDYAAGLVVDHSQGGLTGAFARNSLRRDALVTCLQAAYQKVGKVTGQPPATQVNALMDGWDIRNSAGTCGTQWLRADAADARLHAPHPQWGREIALWSEDPAWHQRAASTLARAAELRGVAAPLLR